MSWPALTRPDIGPRFRRFHHALLLVVAVAVAAAGVIAYESDAFRRLELDTVDARFSIRGTQAPASDVVVVRIDDLTFNELQMRWPFPRSVHARMIDRLRAEGAKTIAYDIQFTEPTTAREDNALIRAVARARGRVVLATTEVDAGGQTNIFGGDEILRRIGARAGHALLPTDPGGVNRRVSYEIDHLETLSVATVEVASGEEVSGADFGDGSRWIDYRGPPGTVRSVSFSRVLRGDTEPELLKGKIVVVGPWAPTLQDVHPTSTTADDLMAGPEIQANAIETVREGLPLRSAPGALDVLLIMLLALAAPVAGYFFRPLPGLALALAAGGLYLVITQIAFNAGTVQPVIYPLGALVVAVGATLAVHYVTAALERERVRQIFARFVPDKVVEDVLKKRDSDLCLGGVRRHVTVMFADLRSFTAYSESHAPEQVIEVLNRYLSDMSEAILDSGGTLVAYMGDGIMAVFGAPVPREDHADRALDASRLMLKRLDGFNEWMRARAFGDGFRMGIGLSTGPVMAGNVGGERRVEYAAIGDTTNIASRLESMTKETPYQLLVSDSTRSCFTRSVSDLVYVDAVKIRGKQASVALWSVPEARTDEPGDETTSLEPALVRDVNARAD